MGGRGPDWPDASHHPEPRYPSTVYEIVGVIPDTQYNSLRGETPPMVFAPDSQFPNLGAWANLMIHSAVDPALTIAAVRNRIRQAPRGLHGIR